MKKEETEWKQNVEYDKTICWFLMGLLYIHVYYYVYAYIQNIVYVQNIIIIQEIYVLHCIRTNS